MPKSLGLGLGEPIEVNSAKNIQQDKKSTAADQGRQPADEQDRIRYGIITKVSEDNLVKVKLLKQDGEAEANDIVNGAYLPLINPLSEVHLKWGMLRKGLICRVFWRGKLQPNSSTVVEIIADEDHNFLKKTTESNEITLMPYKIFSGGTQLV